MGILRERIANKASEVLAAVSNVDGVLELEPQLVTAREAHARAAAAVVAARERFDETGQDDHLFELERVQAAEARAVAHVGRVERLLERARAAAEAARVKALEAKRAELQAGLHARALSERRALLAEQEADAIVALHGLQTRRWGLELTFEREMRELERVRTRLGEDVRPAPLLLPPPPSDVVLARLSRLVDGLPPDDLRMKLAYALAGFIAPNWPFNPRYTPRSIAAE